MMNYANEEKFMRYSYSERGKHHVDKKIENQDTVFVGKVCEDTYCMVVSDGVSSCKYAKQGSEVTVDTIQNLGRKLKSGELGTDDLDGLKRFIVRDWKSHFDSDCNNYGTTLNFLIWCSGDLLIGQIGDGLIISEIDGEIIKLSDTDEFYSVETYALAEVVLKSTIKLVSRKNVKKVSALAMTDGIGKEISMDSLVGF